MIGYTKRKNTRLFDFFEGSGRVSRMQNYVPIYDRLLELNNTNWNSVNLAIDRPISRVVTIDAPPGGVIVEVEAGGIGNRKESREVFIKMAPLLDPFMYVLGKYAADAHVGKLPQFGSPEAHPDVLDPNNAAYVDALFYHLVGKMRTNHEFVHGTEMYGMFLGIQHQFQVDVASDIDRLMDSDFFMKHRGTLFEVDVRDEGLPPLKITDEAVDLNDLCVDLDGMLGPAASSSSSSSLSLSPSSSSSSSSSSSLHSNSGDVMFEVSANFSPEGVEGVTGLGTGTGSTNSINSRSSCSSRSSYTHASEEIKDDEEDDDDDDEEDGDDDREADDIDSDDDRSSWTSEESTVPLTIPDYAVQLICIERCEGTLDSIIDHISSEEWVAMLLQVVLILATYQKVFDFTHNDLHTNNIMFISTKATHLLYTFNNVCYRVPTYGRIYKIIDFGRAIYRFKGQVYCSNSFRPGGDAATQYNIPPYFDEKHRRIDPNPSFDLCRLGCSMYDCVTAKSAIPGPHVDIVKEWCKNDAGVNMLYKSSGVERYPDFKLYKMIARTVHQHTPAAQLARPEFAAMVQRTPLKQKTGFRTTVADIRVDIDALPRYA